MASQKFQALNGLYDLLIQKSTINFDELKKCLGIFEKDIISLTFELINMGLDIHIKDESVTLAHKIDKIDLATLSKKLKLAHVDKPIIYLFSTSSTNESAKANNTPSIYISDHQSAGRGRRLKTWITPLGQSIALSISHQFNCGLSGISGLNIAIGVAIIKTIQKFNTINVGLKWPNDVLATGGKIAGILIDASGNNNECIVTIGIGMNWNIRQPLLDAIEQECMNLGLTHVSRTEFIIQLIIQVEKSIKIFEQSQLEQILADWNKHDIYLGKTINIIQDKTTTQAHYIGINKKGYLQVEIDGKEKSLASGEVTIRKVD